MRQSSKSIYTLRGFLFFIQFWGRSGGEKYWLSQSCDWLCEVKVLSVLRVWIGQADTAEGKGEMSSKEITLAACRPKTQGSQVSPGAGREEILECLLCVRQPYEVVFCPHLKDEEI